MHVRDVVLCADFLEGRLSPKELAVQIKSGVVTVEQLLGLWKTELRPLRLVDYIQPSGAVQIGPSKHSKIMTDVMVRPHLPFVFVCPRRRSNSRPVSRSPLSHHSICFR
jgi:hypothetical protein